MFRRLFVLAAAGCLFASGAFAAAPTPELLARASGSVSIQRQGSENPVMEVARSAYWGAIAGAILGGAVTVMRDDHAFSPVRYGFALGAFGGFGAGVYFVANRPVPSSMLELRQGALAPGAAWAAFEPAPDGMRMRVVGIRF